MYDFTYKESHEMRYRGPKLKKYWEDGEENTMQKIIRQNFL